MVGKCSNSRSTECNRQIREDDWCSKYQKWGVLQSALAIKEQKKESERILKEIQQQKVETESRTSRPLTDEERKEIHARWALEEQKESERKKQEAISAQRAKINRSPIVAGVIGAILSLVAFLLGWIPYWVWDQKRASCKDNLETMFKWGHSMNEPIMQELYADGLHAKEMRDSSIWVPFVLLGVGVVVTFITMILLAKSKTKRIKKVG